MTGMGPMAAMPGMAAMHHHPAMTAFNSALFDEMVAHARSEHLAFPAMVVPPGAAAGESGQGKATGVWIVKSDSQNRPLRVTLRYDGQTGLLKSREDFATRHPIDKVIAYGVAWHEGQLFGLINQLIGLATAAMLVTLVVSGTVMWWRRKPDGQLGAPPILAKPGRLKGVVAWALLVFLLIWLPLFTASLVILLLLDRLLFPRLPKLAGWVGVAPA